MGCMVCRGNRKLLDSVEAKKKTPEMENGRKGVRSRQNSSLRSFYARFDTIVHGSLKCDP